MTLFVSKIPRDDGLNKLPRDVSEKLWIKIRSGTCGIIVTWWIVSIRGKWHGVLATIPWRIADPATHLNRRQPSTGLANTRLLGYAKTTREFADSREDLVIVARNWTLRLVTYAHSKLELFPWVELTASAWYSYLRIVFSLKLWYKVCYSK